MASVSFRLANGANTAEVVLYMFSVEAVVTDEWMQQVQEWFANNLPPSIGWASVHKYSLQVEDLREVDPNP